MLISAAENGHTDCVRLLLENIANVEAKNEVRPSHACMILFVSIHVACTWGNNSDGRGASIYVANINSTHLQDGITALMSSAVHGHSDCVRLLLEGGADKLVKTDVRALILRGIDLQ